MGSQQKFEPFPFRPTTFHPTTISLLYNQDQQHWPPSDRPKPIMAQKATKRTPKSFTKSAADVNTTSTAIPTPFTTAPAALQPLLPQLDPSKVHLIHIDRHSPDHKKQIVRPRAIRLNHPPANPPPSSSSPSSSTPSSPSASATAPTPRSPPTSTSSKPSPATPKAPQPSTPPQRRSAKPSPPSRRARSPSSSTSSSCASSAPGR